MKRLVLTLLLSAAALLAGSTLAPAGVVNAYPTGQSPVIRINVSSVRSSEPFTVTISPCIANEPVIFRFRSATVRTTCDPSTLTASATFTPRVNPGVGPQGFASQARVAQSVVAQAPPIVDVPAPGPYQVCGDLTGTGVTVPSGVTRPATLCTSVTVLDAAGPAVPPVVTTPGGGLPATGSSGLGTTTTSAIVLIAAGAFLLIVTQVRRRRSSHAAS